MMFDDDILLPVVLMIGILIFLLFASHFVSQEEMTRKDILEKTEQYEKYDYCEKIDEKWYCFND